ncbi:serine-aspartate repeat-containing protein I-like isoform X2 [Haliotis rufescens]|uniref:serine-aspartate repeat-containing protein I-like isoform X2 n=1 Tax=Haliotis rufescens TaxID=6454 RepID=UPI00201E7BFC|nr:serine-aspartate repeat-containing protein I-like isoform X2 [Haliotis rufescens]
MPLPLLVLPCSPYDDKLKKSFIYQLSLHVDINRELSPTVSPPIIVIFRPQGRPSDEFDGVVQPFLVIGNSNCRNIILFTAFATSLRYGRGFTPDCVSRFKYTDKLFITSGHLDTQVNKSTFERLGAILVNEYEFKVTDDQSQLGDSTRSDANSQVDKGKSAGRDADSQVDKGKSTGSDADSQVDKGKSAGSDADSQVDKGKSAGSDADSQVDKGKSAGSDADSQVDKGKSAGSDADSQVDKGRSTGSDADSQVDKGKSAGSDADSQVDKGKSTGSDADSQVDKGKSAGSDADSQVDKGKSAGSDADSQVDKGKSAGSDADSQVDKGRSTGSDANSQVDKGKSAGRDADSQVHKGKSAGRDADSQGHKGKSTGSDADSQVDNGKSAGSDADRQVDKVKSTGTDANSHVDRNYSARRCAGGQVDRDHSTVSKANSQGERGHSTGRDADSHVDNALSSRKDVKAGKAHFTVSDATGQLDNGSSDPNSETGTICNLGDINRLRMIRQEMERGTTDLKGKVEKRSALQPWIRIILEAVMEYLFPRQEAADTSEMRGRSPPLSGDDMASTIEDRLVLEKGSLNKESRHNPCVHLGTGCNQNVDDIDRLRMIKDDMKTKTTDLQLRVETKLKLRAGILPRILDKVLIHLEQEREAAATAEIRERPPPLLSVDVAGKIEKQLGLDEGSVNKIITSLLKVKPEVSKWNIPGRVKNWWNERR